MDPTCLFDNISDFKNYLEENPDLDLNSGANGRGSKTLLALAAYDNKKLAIKLMLDRRTGVPPTELTLQDALQESEKLSYTNKECSDLLKQEIERYRRVGAEQPTPLARAAPNNGANMQTKKAQTVQPSMREICQLMVKETTIPANRQVEICEILQKEEITEVFLLNMLDVATLRITGISLGESLQLLSAARAAEHEPREREAIQEQSPEGRLLCSVCLDEDKREFFQCGHGFCEKDSREIFQTTKLCPECRQLTRFKMKVYL